MSDLESLLDEVSSFQIPARLERFLYREKPPSSSERSLAYFAYSYELAFGQLAESMKERWRANGLLHAPLFYIGRHSIELHLKHAIEEFSDFTGKQKLCTRHELLPLWNELQRQIELAAISADGDPWTAHVGRIIKHIQNMDPKGDSFRYPHNVAGQPFPYTRIAFDGLVKAHGSVTAYCGATIDMLIEYRANLHSY